MKALDSIVHDLEVLPTKQVEKIADAVHQVKEKWLSQRKQALDELFGSMDAKEADTIEQAINEQFKRIDP